MIPNPPSPRATVLILVGPSASTGSCSRCVGGIDVWGSGADITLAVGAFGRMGFEGGGGGTGIVVTTQGPSRMRLGRSIFALITAATTATWPAMMNSSAFGA